MMAYFKPLRQKLGVLALVMALVLTVFWFRGMVISDQFVMKLGSDFHSIESLEGRFAWSRFRGSDAHAKYFVEWTTNKHSNGRPSSPKLVRNASPQSGILRVFHSHWFFCGTKFTTGNWCINGESTVVGKHGRFHFWEVPCWIIVLVMTLMSAYLLLSKPHKKL